MINKKFIFIGSYVGEDVSGSHRQERFIKKALELNTSVILLKPSGNWIGKHDFNNLNDFHQWKLINKPKIFSGSISTNRFKKYLIIIKYLLFLDIFGYGFFTTIRLLIKYNNIFKGNCFIMVSSPSISSAVAIYLYSILFNKKIKYSIDMRDAWANHKSIKVFKKIRRKIESKVLSKADNIITVSKYLKDEFENSYSINVDLLYNVNLNINFETLYKDNLKNNKTTEESNFKFCYFGSLPSGFYNLKSFCEGLTLFVKNNIDYKDKYTFHFYGPCLELESILPLYPLIRDSFFFYSSVSHEKALSLMKNCDAVLFFGYNAEKNAGVVSTKIFEYFYLKVKIITFDVRKESDLDWLIQNACGQSIIINDSISFSKYLFKFFKNINVLPSCTNDDFLVDLDKSYENFFNEKIIF